MLLETLKRFVGNQARPKGSIVEAYIVKECTTFCSMYLQGVDTVFNREERNDDGGKRGPRLKVFLQNVRPFGKIRNAADVSQKESDMAHWFALHDSPEVELYLEYVLISNTCITCNWCLNDAYTYNHMFF